MFPMNGRWRNQSTKANQSTLAVQAHQVLINDSIMEQLIVKLRVDENRIGHCILFPVFYFIKKERKEKKKKNGIADWKRNDRRFNRVSPEERRHRKELDRIRSS